MSTIRESISRIRNSVKVANEDAFITDRYIYSLIKKYGEVLIYKESITQNIYKNSDVFKEIPCFPLREVPVIETCCSGFDSGCRIMRSEFRLPKMIKTSLGNVIKSVTSIDYSIQCHQIQPALYAQMRKSSSFKYNKTKYFWITDGYLYIPDVEWDSVRIQAMFDSSIADFLCSSSAVGDDSHCAYRQDDELFIPEHLLAEAEQMALKEIYGMVQIPGDTADDNQHIMRS